MKAATADIYSLIRLSAGLELDLMYQIFALLFMWIDLTDWMNIAKGLDEIINQVKQFYYSLHCLLINPVNLEARADFHCLDTDSV